MTTAFCSYQERISDSGRSLTPQLKAPARASGDLDGRVGVVALADVQKSRDAADVAELELVEAVLAAGQGQDDAVLGYLLGKFGVVVAARFGAVAAADQEEVLDRAGLDRLDDLVGHAQHGIVAEAGQDLLARGFREAGEFQGLVDDRGEVPAVDVLDAGPCHQAPGEQAVGVGIGRALDAVGVEDDRRRGSRGIPCADPARRRRSCPPDAGISSGRDSRGPAASRRGCRC